jgi:hypothetical protein
MLGTMSWLFEGAGTAAAAALAGFGTRFARRRRRSPSRLARTTVFTAGPDSHMSDYRNELDKVIISARHCVYLSGPGFDPSGAGRRQAATYADALRSTLRRGIRVVRVQTTPEVASFWLEHLSDLLSEFPQIFELWAFVEPPNLPLPGMCAIDPDDPAHSVTEFMIQMRRHLGTRDYDAAGTAVFIQGHPLLAQGIRDRIVELTKDSSRVARVPDAAAVATILRSVDLPSTS